jgi:hypothetical protein
MIHRQETKVAKKKSCWVAKSKRRGAELAEDFAERIGWGLLDACYFPEKLNAKKNDTGDAVKKFLCRVGILCR